LQLWSHQTPDGRNTAVEFGVAEGLVPRVLLLEGLRLPLRLLSLCDLGGKGWPGMWSRLFLKFLGGVPAGIRQGKVGPPPGVSPKEAWHGFSDGVQKLNTKMLIVEKKTWSVPDWRVESDVPKVGWLMIKNCSMWDGA